MTIMQIHAQIKTDNVLLYISNKMKPFFVYYNIKHVTGILHNHTGQAVIKRAKLPLKVMLINPKGRVKTLEDRLNNALLTLTFLNVGKQQQLRDTGQLKKLSK